MTTAVPDPGAGHRIELVALSDIEFAEVNPRRHAIDRLKLSLRKFGVAAPAIRDERTGRLVAGHGRTLALREIRQEGPTGAAGEVWPPQNVQVTETGAWLVPVVCGWSSTDDTQAMAYLIADNRHGELSSWDNDGLTAMLEQIRDNDADGDMQLLHASGYLDAELADMLKLAEPFDLDELAEKVGDGDRSDGWPTVKIKVPHHLSAGWMSHLDTHCGDEVQAFAALLGLDPTPQGAGEWKPDLWESRT